MACDTHLSPTWVRSSRTPISRSDRSRPRLAICGGDDRVAGQLALGQQVAREDGQDVVAVALDAGLVQELAAVGVAVEDEADVGHGGHHGLAGPLGAVALGAAVDVDVDAVGPDVERHDLGAQAAKDLRGQVGGRAVGAVQHHPQPAQRAWRRRKPAAGG